MIDYSSLLNFIRDSALSSWSESLRAQIEAGLSTQRYGDLPDWYAAMSNLPSIQTAKFNFKTQVEIGLASEIDSQAQSELDKQLRKLIPWRKGPYKVFGIDLNTEWRSDWKWERLLPHISPLKNKLVLDVGCGNGYHCWRMFGEDANRVIGIDPSPRFVVQFYTLKKLLEQKNADFPVDVLPLGIEALPEKLEVFDTTFSMGILYHRRSPMDHLRELMDTLKPGGELVLETLVIEGERGQCLVPEGRYAKMNNVWFIPSVETLLSWMNKIGYTNVRCVDTNITSRQEQRATDWMQFQSLEDFLDPHDSSKTVEGHPAPMRAIILANKI